MSYESHLLDVRGPNYRHLSPEHQFWKKKPPFGSCKLLMAKVSINKHSIKLYSLFNDTFKLSLQKLEVRLFALC